MHLYIDSKYVIVEMVLKKYIYCFFFSLKKPSRFTRIKHNVDINVALGLAERETGRRNKAENSVALNSVDLLFR